jgi:cytochrome o ubiquinol oxidase subunit 2
LDPQGPIGAAERLILIDATGIMLVIVIPVIVMTFAFAWRFRASNERAVYRPDWVYSGQIELTVWAIPTLIALLLGVVGWISAHELDPGKPLTGNAAPLRIEVVALDWQWLFIYPDAKVATVNELVVPVGTPLEFTLTSATVMNAFFVPQLGSQVYVMPGMSTHLNLRADGRGDFPGLASHFSGDGFSDMRFIVHSVSATDYASWLATARRSDARLDATSYGALTTPTLHPTTRVYGGVTPDLFREILAASAPMTASRPSAP